MLSGIIENVCLSIKDMAKYHFEPLKRTIFSIIFCEGVGKALRSLRHICVSMANLDPTNILSFLSSPAKKLVSSNNVSCTTGIKLVIDSSSLVEITNIWERVSIRTQILSKIQ
jgi:hypothetical protein